VKTKHCRVCDIVLTTKNKYRSSPKTKGNGSICYPCYLTVKRARYKSRTKNLSLYIEGKNYPRTKVRSGISTRDNENLRLSKVFPDIAEYEMFKKGRAFFTSRYGSRPAREGFSSKVGTRVGIFVYTRQNNEVTKQYQHQVCDECDGNDIRIDSRGYKYCTKCFLI
jgi:hypothetical protein